MPNTTRNTSRILGAFALAITVTAAAEAGPPLICHPFDAGTASVLPWGSGPGWNTPDPAYDVRRLTADTLRLLDARAPILARMENLRRATIYASRDRRVAAELLSAVLGRALSAAAHGSGDSLAWFDAGHLVESYRQASHIYAWDMVSGRDGASPARQPGAIDGYRFVQKALELTGANAEMEYAASLMTEGAVSAAHRRRAEAGAAVGSLLARNLAK